VRPGAVLAALALLLVIAPACGRGDDADGGDVPFVAVDENSRSATDRAIARAQAVLREDPDDPNARLDLAQAFLQKVRETGDPTLYTKADELLGSVAEDAPENPRVLVSQGTLALARHQFEEALDHGQRALEAAPGNEAALGVIVDANNELGRYDAALDATQQMVDARPSLASLSRASYARELRGDLDGAIDAMSQAVTAGRSTGGGENLAFVQVQLGHLLVTRGDLAEAERTYAAAEEAFPGFPAAKAGRARLLVVRQEYAEAAELLREVLDVLPLPEYAIARGDALLAAGADAEAEEAYALVEVLNRLQSDNGVDTDLELALFEADHEPGPDAVERAERAVEHRPSIFAHDALAWNRHQDDQPEEAARSMRRALATGSRDPMLRYHAAAIADAVRDRAAAVEHLGVVLETNPRFSAALVDDVERLADELGLAMEPPPR
jgi:tetratricopeptide (TPR) repeat protein